MDRPSLAIFPSPSAAGVELAQSLAGLGQRLGFKALIIEAATRERYLVHAEACYRATAVVMDGSIENDRYDMYKSVAVQPNLFGHVLTVSRTYLPLNFIPSRTGGAPHYPYPYSTLDPETRTATKSGWGNKEILAWVEGELCRILAAPGPRLSEQELSSLESDPTPMHKLISDALGASGPKENRRRVFLSYRGENYAVVSELARRIADGKLHQDGAREVSLFTPGELAYERELLTEGRRWMIMGLLEEELRKCDELWVCRRRQPDNYLESWWTVAELVSAAYCSEELESRIRIRIYDLDTGHLTDDDNNTFRVALPEAEKQKLARYVQNPTTMSPEHNPTFRVQRWMFRLGLGDIVLPKMAKMVDSSVIHKNIFNAFPDELRKFILEGMRSRFSNPKAYREWIFERHFDSGFWEKVTLDLSREDQCSTYTLNPTEFIDAPEKRMAHLSSMGVSRAVRLGKPVRPKGRKTRLKIREVAPRYLWIANRAISPFPGGLVRLPTYVADYS